MNNQQEMLALYDFLLGAELQTNPYLDDFGRQDEPDDLFSHQQREEPVKRNNKFEDYVKIFCGDRKLAMHWYLKHNPPKGE